MNRSFNFLLMILLGISLSSLNAQAQTLTVHNGPGTGQTISSRASAPVAPSNSQGLVAAVSNLPEADALIYVNPQRILNEVVPQLAPAKDVEEMRKAFEEIKSNFGIDPTHVEYIVMAVRFKKPTADLQFQAPEVMAVAGGDFNAESLMVVARMAAGGKLRDESYGGKTLGLITIDPIVKEAEKNPLLKGFTEVGIVTLNGNTVAAGAPSYLRAAVDAAGGKDRISSETLNSLVRDPNALISIAGKPWHSFAKSFGMMGTEASSRTPGCDVRIGDFYAALTMDSSDFILRGAVNEDNPDTAKIFSNLFSGLLAYAASSIKDPAAQTMVKRVGITAEGVEVILRANFPREMVVNLVRAHMMKPKKVETPTPPAPPKQPVKRRRTRRRG